MYDECEIILFSWVLASDDYQVIFYLLKRRYMYDSKLDMNFSCNICTVITMILIFYIRSCKGFFIVNQLKFNLFKSISNVISLE